jgi:hypothetical protein
LNFLTTFAPNRKEHAKNVDRFWGDPSELLSHSEIVPDGVVFSDSALGDPEPVSLPNSKTSPLDGNASVTRPSGESCTTKGPCWRAMVEEIGRYVFVDSSQISTGRKIQMLAHQKLGSTHFVVHSRR